MVLGVNDVTSHDTGALLALAANGDCAAVTVVVPDDNVESVP